MININETGDWDGIVTTSTVETGDIPFIQLTMTFEGLLKYEIYTVLLSEGTPKVESYYGTTELTGAWHQVAASVDGANLKLYVDGQIEGDYTDERFFALSEIRQIVSS